jgi:hypothetical protein
MRPLILGSLFWALLLTLPAQAADEKNPNDSQEIDANKLRPGFFVGKVVSTPGSDKGLTLQIQSARVERNPGQRNPYKVVKVNFEITFQMADDVAVRVLSLPIEYDDKGEMKKLTPEEFKERKGKDPKMIGFASKPEDLKGGQVVRITLARKKADMGNADKDADKEVKEDKAAAGPKNEVKMIIILDESGVGNESPGLRKPKKKK